MRGSLIPRVLPSLLLSLAVSYPPADAAPQASSPTLEAVRRERLECVERYTAALLAIVAECAEPGVEANGAELLGTVVLETGGNDSRTAPERLLATEEIEAKAQRALRRFVRDVSRLANRCVEEGFPALGYEVVLFALQFDPQNPRLRRALRQRPWADAQTGEIRWYAPFDYAQARAGRIDHPRYGWLTNEALERIEMGLAEFRGQWLPKAQVEALRRQWSGRWKHLTQHFVVYTNTAPEKATAFGRSIERLYAFVYRVWVDFFAFDDPQKATRLVLGGGLDLDGRRLRVHYHRSRESYLWEMQNDPLLRGSPGRQLARESDGFYWGQTGRVYFFERPGGLDLRTVYHEVTHQIFAETYPAGAAVPTWLAEGIAVFMENAVVRGPPGAERLVAGTRPPPGVLAAATSTQEAGSPQAAVCDINAFMRELQSNEAFHSGDRAARYATAGAIVHFFLLYGSGVHRRPFIRYAREAYRNDFVDDPTPVDALYEHLGLSERELQEEWQAFNRSPDVLDF